MFTHRNGHSVVVCEPFGDGSGGEDFVCWLLNVPATCKCISGTEAARNQTPSGSVCCCFGARLKGQSSALHIFFDSQSPGLFWSPSSSLLLKCPLYGCLRKDPLGGLMVKASASRAADAGFDFRFPRWDIFRTESYQSLKTLPHQSFLSTTSLCNV